MKYLLAILLSVCVHAAAAQVQTRPPYTPSAQALGLKQQIVRICLANQTRTDNWPQVRAQLEPLIQQLVAITPPRTETEQLYQVLGDWRQVWSDAFFYKPTRAGSIDLKTVHQVVFPGHYYNVSRFTPSDGGSPRTGFLRGAFRATPEYLQPVFTKSVFGIGTIPGEGDVTTYAMWAEAGLYDAQPAPHFIPYLPETPLINPYVDYDFRVLTNPPGADGSPAALFIFVRANQV
jgi:hypothetical protein